MMKFLTALFLTTMVFVQGCGYTTKSALRPEWKTIYVSPVVNGIDFANQYERPLYIPMLEVRVRNAINERFLRDGYLGIANSAEDADVVLKIKLTAFRHDPLRYDSDRNVREWRVVITVQLELWDRRTREIIWTAGASGSQDQFRLGSQTSSEDTAVQAAVDDLSRHIVENTIEHQESFLFMAGELDAGALRKSLKIRNKQNDLILEKLNITADDFKKLDKLDGARKITEQHFISALNDILKMRDFHSYIDVDAYASELSDDMKEFLERAQAGEKLESMEYIRLNRALLEAIYPLETRQIQ